MCAEEEEEEEEERREEDLIRAASSDPLLKWRPSPGMESTSPATPARPPPLQHSWLCPNPPRIELLMRTQIVISIITIANLFEQSPQLGVAVGGRQYSWATHQQRRKWALKN